jgi:hypothetical protein
LRLRLRLSVEVEAEVEVEDEVEHSGVKRRGCSIRLAGSNVITVYIREAWKCWYA